MQEIVVHSAVKRFMDKTNTPQFFGIPANLAVMASAVFIWGLGEGLFIFFLPLALQHWQADTVQTGAVLSMIGVMMALVQAPAGYLADRLGTRPLILAAQVLGVGAAAVMSAANSLALFVAGLLAYSLTSLISAPLNSYLTSQRGGWSVQRAVTFVSASMVAGEIVGPVLGGWIAGAAGMNVLFRCSTVLFLLSTLVTGLAGRAPAPAQHERSALQAGPLANRRFLGFVALISLATFCLSAPQQFTSLYLQNVHHLAIEQIGVLGAAASLGSTVIMYALGGLGAPAGLLAGQALVAGYALALWRGQSLPVFLGGNFLLGGYRLYRGMALAYGRSLVRDNEVGFAYGLVETGSALAVILAPLAAGALYNYQPASVYVASLCALAVTAALHLAFLRPPAAPS